MKRWEVTVGKEVTEEAMLNRVGNVCSELGLSCTMRGTLAKYPGCVHWHFKRGKEKGVVEVTMWMREIGLVMWVGVQGGRIGPATLNMAEKLAAALGAS